MSQSATSTGNATSAGKLAIEADSAIPPPGMAWVPGGKSIIGSDSHYPEERPAHEIEVEGFWMDISPVTNAQFAVFVEETGHVTTAELPPAQADYPDVPPERLVSGSAVFVAPTEPVDLSHPTWWQYVPGADWRHPDGPGSTIKGLDHHPVVHIAYADALAYAAWANKQLPTEAQWEHAARGGLEGATYPWGDQLTTNGHRMANYWHGTFPWHNLKPHPPSPTPAGTFPPNPYGLYDMCGSVWEWTCNVWEPSHNPPNSQHQPSEKPARPADVWEPRHNPKKTMHTAKNPASILQPASIGKTTDSKPTAETNDQPKHPSDQNAAGRQSPCCAPAARSDTALRPDALPHAPQAAHPPQPAVHVIKGGSFLCSENYCTRYRPAARFPQSADTSTNHLGFRCMLR